MRLVAVARIQVEYVIDVAEDREEFVQLIENEVMYCFENHIKDMEPLSLLSAVSIDILGVTPHWAYEYGTPDIDLVDETTRFEED